MANKYFYSNVAVSTTLASAATAGVTSIEVGSTTGFPSSYPYILALDFEGTSEELVKVTAGSGTSLTVERAFGGTSAQSHSLGAPVRHVVNAVDLTDFRTHEQDGTAVHGLAGDVVGTSDTQTLTNKTLTSPAVDGGALSSAFSGAPDFTGNPIFSGNPTFSGAPSFTGAPVFTGGAAFRGATASEEVFKADVSGDASPRLGVNADGALTWGSGAVAGDTNLYRSAADTLATDDQLQVNSVDITRDALTLNVDGYTDPHFYVSAEGKMFWGDGSGATDVSLTRPAASALETSGSFSAAVTTSTTFTPAAGFSLLEADLRKTCGVCTISVKVNVTSDISPQAGFSNIVDQAIGTLPAGFRPFDIYIAIWGTGIESGDVSIAPDGVVTLRSSDTDQTINAGADLHFSATYVL